MKTMRCAAVLALCAAGCWAEEARSDSPRARNKAAVERMDRENAAKYAGRADVMVRHGLVADRRARQVEIAAEAIGLEKDGNPPEYFLITEGSSHDYEALAVSFAAAGDIRDALVFIGMPVGQPCNPGGLRFWPKGERIFATFRCDDARRKVGPVRAEAMFLDTRTGKPLPVTGLVFAGSQQVPSPQNTNLTVCAADVQDPGSIASNYNEPLTVLDIPRQVAKGAAYDFLRVNPEHLLPRGALVSVTLEPEYRDGRRRVVELDLGFRAGTNGAVSCRLARVGGEEIVRAGRVEDVLRECAALCAGGHDPFVTVGFDGGLAVRAVRELCALLASVETENGLRFEPPREGDLYYKAFVPPEKFRERANRLAQPWELHLARKADGVLSARLTKIEEVWKSGDFRPDLKVQHFEIAGPEALPKALAEHGPGLPVILAFVEPTLALGDLMRFVRPVLKTHGTVHVYLQ